ncbi:LOW QUALITY PROTEIN: drebrin-like protein B [Neosynchiropus ocellatus]
MSVNLSKNGTALRSAYEEVVNPKSDTNWALFTYEGNSNDLRLAETGGGGLEQLVEELNSGKIMYAFCRVQDPNSGLPKFVLINWTGEGVKDSRKGVCANHLGSIRNFLKGAHVTINARDEDDVEPEMVLAKVAKASGANFNFHQQTQERREAPRGPVGSVYRKINAVEEIQQTNKDDFWTQNQRDEEERRREENQRAEEERRTREREWREMEDKKARERRERDEREREEREERERRERDEREREEIEEMERREREWREMENKKARERRERDEREKEERREREEEREREERADRERRERERKERDKAEELRDAQQRREEDERGGEKQQREGEHRKSGISTAASVQKANEARSLISQRSFNPREMFLQREKSVEESPQRHAAPSRGKLQSPFLSQKSSGPGSPPAVTSPDIYSSPVSPAVYRTHPEPTEEPAPAADPEDEWSDEFDDDDVDESGGGEWSHGGGVWWRGLTRPAAGSNPNDPQDRWHADEQDEDVYEDFYQTPVREDTATAANQGPSARALYDYQAADESEITFDPDDIITGIDMVDEGWWRGFGPDGRYGMFPANYVELL